MSSIKIEDQGETQQDVELEAQVPVEPVFEIPQEEAAVPQTRKRSPGVFKSIVVATVLILIGGLAYVIKDRNDLKNEVSKLSQTKQVDPNQEAKDLSAEVGRLIEVPTDEVPTIATVIDADKVKNQPFFTKAVNGDKVLLYSKSGKAILYRPSTKKIIEVAPINIGANQTQSTPTTTKKN